jgi:hypothetical protein
MTLSVSKPSLTCLSDLGYYVVSAAPCQPEEIKKYHGSIRDMIGASSHVPQCFVITKRRYPQWVYSVGLIFVSERKNKRQNHHP